MRYFALMLDKKEICGVIKSAEFPDLPFLGIMEITYNTFLDFYFLKV